MLNARQIVVRPAGVEEQEQILAILSEAADWLLARGFRQWPSPFPAKDIQDDLTGGRIFLAMLDDEVAGTITLRELDPIFWPNGGNDAFYVHRLAIRRRDRGLGDFLLHWAERRAQSEGKTFVRLDVWKENRALRDYYEQRGFECVGDIDGMLKGTPWACALYEKLIA